MDPKSATRKLSAILSADVQGYSRLMGDDEIATVKTITEYRKTFTSLVEEWKGRVIDSPGDNILAEFSSVVDAVQCAVEIQNILQDKNEELPENRRMIFRMGVNLGDVIHEEDRIYGDGVNIAARIESLADGGGISISGTAYDQIKNKLALDYSYMGEHPVKNISEPVRVYKVPMHPEDVQKKIGGGKSWKKTTIVSAVLLILAGAAAVIWNFYPRSAPTPTKVATNKTPITESSEKTAPLPLPDKPSVAVLPFANISGDPKEDYLSDGITEQIITALSKTPKLFVIARNSVFTYKGKPVKVQQVSRDLGVRYVLEGSVQKSEDKIRITAQLIDATTGEHLWAERYDRELRDIFALQDEITMQILTSLRVKLTDGEQLLIYGGGTTNLESYTKFLQGLYKVHRNEKGTYHASIKKFEEVISLDPQYPAPYFWLAWAQRWVFVFDRSVDPGQSLAKAMSMVKKGIALDDSNAFAFAVLSMIYQAQGQHEKSVSTAEEAVTLEPNMAEAHVWLGVSLHYVGRYDEAINQLNMGIRLNPIPPGYYNMFLGNAYQLAGMYEESIAAYKKAILFSPNHLFPHMRLAVTYSLMGREKDARAEAAEVLRINPKFSVEHFIKVVPYKSKAVKDLLLEGMHRAGLK